MHRFLIGDNLAYERLAIYGYNLITCQQSSLFGWSVLNHILHMDGVLADDKLDAYARERTLEVVGGGCCILRTDIDRVRIQFGKNLRNRLIDQRIDVHGIYILVIDEVEQVVQTVASTIDDIESVAGEMIRKECADDDAQHNAERHDEGHIPIGLILIHIHN